MFDRHLARMTNWHPPGGRLPFHLGPDPVGWIKPDLAPTLLAAGATEHAGAITLPDPTHLDGLVEAATRAGACALRGERFDVRAHPGGPVLATIDRGALPTFGIEAEGVHVNGVVRRPDGPHLWIARRSLGVRMEPGKLDHIVAGGMPAGMTALDTLIKEAEEEASIPEPLARTARPASEITYAMERAEGLRRDRLHVFDLELPEDFRPKPQDDEVEAFELWPAPKVAARVRDTDDFKFNVNFVLIDFFRRWNIVPD